MEIITGTLGFLSQIWKVYVNQCGLIMLIRFGNLPLEDYNISKISCLILKLAEVLILTLFSVGTVFGAFHFLHLFKKPQSTRLMKFGSEQSYPTMYIEDLQKQAFRGVESWSPEDVSLIIDGLSFQSAGQVIPSVRQRFTSPSANQAVQMQTKSDKYENMNSIIITSSN